MSLLAKAVHIDLTGDSSTLVSAMDKGKSSVKGFGDESEKSGKKSNQAFDLIKNVGVGAMLGVGTALTAMGVASIKSASNMQNMGVSLKTAMGGSQEATDAALKTIVDFAAKTPYALGEVQGAFVKLKNMGLDPSTEALTAYGDTASAMGKSLNDMVEAVADAATGEFERLKEFGIRSQSEGDRVKFTFKGVTKEVGKNSEEIQTYLKDLGKTNFGGGMEAQSKTLTGVFSTFSDTLQLKLGEVATKSGVLDVLSNGMTKFGAEIDKVDISKVQAGFSQFAQEMQTMFAPQIKVITDLFNGQLKPALMEIWKQLEPTLIPTLKVLGTILVGTVIVAIVAFGASLNIMAAIISSVITGAKTAFDTFKTSLFNTFDGLKIMFNGFIKVVKSLLSGDLSGAIEGAKEIIMGFAKIDLTQLGKDMIQGLINGIGSMAGALWNKMTEMANSAMNAVKGILGIKSPSVVFQGFGVNTVEGFNIGIDKQLPNLENKMLQLSEIVMKPFGGNYNTNNSKNSQDSYDYSTTTYNYTQPQKATFGWLETA
jgi:Tape measure protein